MTKEVKDKKNKNHEVDAITKKDHKNSRSSHQQEHSSSGKIGLFGKPMSRQHANKELLDDALDLMDAQESSHFRR